MTVTPSIAVEVAWRLCHRGGEPGHSNAPTAFWDDGYGGGEELVVLAHHHGLLATTDFDELGAGLRARPGAIDDGLRLASEQDEARAAVAWRVDRLRRSAKRRAAYVDMLESVWGELRAEWVSVGHRRVVQAADRYRARLRNGVAWPELAPNGKVDQFMPGLLDRVGYDIAITLVPTLAFGRMFVLDLGDTVVVAVPTRPLAPGELGTEHLTRRLKALAHPTRLAIMRDLATTSRSIGDLADTFGLAQPTVTNHVKLLRDAGLLRPDESEGPRALRTDPTTVRAVLDEMADLLGSGSTTVGAMSSPAR